MPNREILSEIQLKLIKDEADKYPNADYNAIKAMYMRAAKTISDDRSSNPPAYEYLGNDLSEPIKQEFQKQVTERLGGIEAVEETPEETEEVPVDEFAASEPTDEPIFDEPSEETSNLDADLDKLFSDDSTEGETSEEGESAKEDESSLDSDLDALFSEEVSDTPKDKETAPEGTENASKEESEESPAEEVNKE